MQTQPNFEKLKKAFYQAYVDSDKATTPIMLQSLNGIPLPAFYKRVQEFKKDFNIWLDRLDIRQAGTLIDILKEDNKTVPGWMAYKQYYIDYNRHNMLDLIRIEND